MRFLFARGLTNCPPCRRPAFTHAGRATVAERGQHTICRSGRTAERFAASATAGRSRGRTPGCRTSAASQTARTACRFCFWDGFNWLACSRSSNGSDGASSYMFEVKATTGTDWVIELGATGLETSQRFARTNRYRFLFVSNVLDATRRKVFVLPNLHQRTMRKGL
jgi:hypothetical protein